MHRPTISVIIPTTCEARRWDSLQRAIAGILAQEQVDAGLIVVVNGERFAPDCVAQLRAMQGVRVLYQAEGSAPLAQRLGRQTVETDFFCFLDDDDEYLPGALWRRVQPMLASPQIGFTASNGYRLKSGQETLAVQRADAVMANPLAALSSENWLSSCGGLFRSAQVTAKYFDNPAPFYEWTYLAYKLARDFKMAWVAEPTFRIHDTPASLSKSDAFRACEADVLKRILALGLPAPVAREVQEKLGRTYHDLSSDNIALGRRGPAWRYHMISLAHRGGWRYLLYTRKLLTPR